MRLGVVYGQGWMFGRPGPSAYKLTEEMREKIKRLASQEARTQFRNLRSIDIGTIALSHPTFTSDTPCRRLDNHFRRHPESMGMPIVDGDRVVGLIMREAFYNRLGSKYGYALFQEAALREVMNRQPLIVASDTPIEQVSLLAMARSEANLYDYVLVEEEGHSLGVVTVKHLLQTTTNLEISYAKYANPITSLPGSVIIEREVQRVITEQPIYSVIFVDLNNFKPFNEVYGFNRGDDVIRFLADCLKETFGEQSPDIFIGHFGADNFVVVVHTHDLEPRLKELIDLFHSHLREFFSDEDFERGYFFMKTRQGELFPIPLLSLAATVTNNDGRNFSDYRELARMASSLNRRVKALAKERQGESVYIFERRAEIN
jgi:GGDEF domain-containing protein